jgi:hypothetical protein
MATNGHSSRVPQIVSIAREFDMMRVAIAVVSWFALALIFNWYCSFP